MPDKKKFLDYVGLSNYHNKLIKIIDNKIDWNNLKNKPFYEETKTYHIEIKPSIYTGSSGGGALSPIDIDSSYIQEGEYLTFEDGQTYNVTYNGVLYENLPVREVSVFGTSFYCIGNWDSVVLRSNLVLDYPDPSSLVDGDLPFLFAQVGEQAVFAFFKKDIEDQTLTFTDASDPTKTCTIQVPASQLTRSLPFMEAFVGDNVKTLITDGQEADILVDGETVSGAWKVFDNSNPQGPGVFFVPEGLDFDVLFPNGINEEPDEDEAIKWPCLIIGQALNNIFAFGNFIFDEEDERCYEVIDFNLTGVNVVQIEKKFISSLRLEDLEDALDESGEGPLDPFLDMTVDINNGSVTVTPSGIINYASTYNSTIYMDFDDNAPAIAAQLANQNITVVFDNILLSGLLSGNDEESLVQETEDYTLTVNSAFGFSFNLAYNNSVDLNGTHAFKIYIGEATGVKRVIKPKYLPDMSKDWAENDSTKSSYIKNRTHYEEPVADPTASADMIFVVNPNTSEEISLSNFLVNLRTRYFSQVDDSQMDVQLDDTVTIRSGDETYENMQFAMYHAEPARAGNVYRFGIGDPNKTLSLANNYLNAYNQMGCSDRINTNCNFFVDYELHSYSGYYSMDTVTAYKTKMGVHKLDPKFIDFNTATLSDIDEVWNTPLIQVMSCGAATSTPGPGINGMARFNCLLEVSSDTDSSKCGYVYYSREFDEIHAYWTTDKTQDPETGTDISNKITESPQYIVVEDDGNWPETYEVTLDIEDIGQVSMNSEISYYK